MSRCSGAALTKVTLHHPRTAAADLVGRRTNRFQYDGLDRLSEIALAVDATHALTNRFVYNDNDECVQVLGGDAVSGADPHQTVAYEYDERGLRFHAITAPGSSLIGTNEFSYTASSQPATKQYMDIWQLFPRLASASTRPTLATIRRPVVPSVER